jgi:DNA-binding protein HU-beta
MKNGEIIGEISRYTGLGEVKTEAIVTAFMSTVEQQLVDKKVIWLRGFGSFKLKKRAVKKARNINKNTEVIVPEHFIPSFKPSKKFRERVKKEIK